MVGEGAPRGWLKWLERAVALAVLVFLAIYLARNWSRIDAHDWSVHWGRIALASVVLAVVYSGFVALWRHVLARLGGTLSLLDAHRIWYLANLARYVPGRVLMLAGTGYMARAKGVSPVLAVASAVVAQAFLLGTGCAVAALALPETANAGESLYAVGAVAAAVFFLVLLTPAFGALHRLTLRLARRAETYVPVPWPERLGLATGYTISWLALGTSFWLFLTSITPLEADSLWAIVGIHAAGYVVGYLAVFVPSGLGVREGVYALLLSLYIPPTIAVAAAILARVWSTAVELAVAGTLVALFGVADLRVGADPSPERSHG